MGVRTHVHVKGRTYVTSANLLVNSGNDIFLFFVFFWLEGNWKNPLAMVVMMIVVAEMLVMMGMLGVASSFTNCRSW